jgi:hypothetical protein
MIASVTRALSAGSRILRPDEGMPRWSGRLMWRGTANWSKFGAGKHFVVAGSNDTRLVLYPIGAGESAAAFLCRQFGKELSHSLDRLRPSVEEWHS